MMDRCLVHHLGLVEYKRAWQMQDRLAGEIAAGERPATLLLLEHPHTFTFGRRGQAHNLVWDDAELARRGVSVHWVDRGGDVTYHGPGQLVGYPLLPLGGLSVSAAPGGGARIPQADYVGYLRKLEQALIETLAQFDIPSRRVEGKTGVWVDTGEASRSLKIASIGVKVDARGVTRHGFALNVAPDMSYWEGIVACGLADDAMTCMADVQPPAPGLDVVSRTLAAAFGRIFNYEMLEGSI